MLALLALLAAGAAAPAPDCAIDRPAACATTNALVWQPGFDKALAGFFGALRGDYVMPGARVSAQAREVLGGPPDAPLRLADGNLLFTACRAHVCPEKGALVVSDSGRIRAAGIMHYGCSSKGCGDTPQLALFYRNRADRDSIAIAAIIGWARAQSGGEAPPRHYVQVPSAKPKSKPKA